MNKIIMMNFKFLFFLLSTLFVFAACEKKEDTPDIPEEPVEQVEGALKIFKFEKKYNPQLSTDVELTIYNNKNIAGHLNVTVDMKALIPTFDVEDGQLYCNDVLLKSGQSTCDFSSIVSIVLLEDDGDKVDYKVMLLPYTGLPVVTICTENERFPQDKVSWVPTRIKIDGMGVFPDYTDSVGIRGRGNVTWGLPKQAFNMKLTNKDALLNMPNQKRWCFLANWRDRTLLRNDVAFHIGQQTALAWTPRSQFVEVIFNGVHMGNYQLTEQVRIDKNRVNIKEMKSEHTDAIKITGGYLLEIDSYWDEENKFKSATYNLPFNIKNPDADVLVPVQKEYIENYINNIEDKLSKNEFAAAYNYLDMNSCVDYWIVQALTGNTEIVNPLSVYCYKERSGKLFMGPLWDFDKSFSSVEAAYNGKTTLHYTSWWYNDLFKDTTFKTKVKNRFNELLPKLKDVPQYIQVKANYLSNSERLNWQKWQIDTTILDSTNGDETIDNYQEAINRMISIYNGRLELLKGEIEKF
ncbi:spore coat protein CotH [Bacteroides sp. 214]|uniref:CotH kinase family protein n=1 Tax=Bacteroides sp. 214 TaxID=2302935 RepID=UPI0013D339F5|nr:CotH kinase family protein [Bacteroides sp. 214]NDW12736.1 spore coat protein CotH [Bacteroides sp. 214]